MVNKWNVLLLEPLLQKFDIIYVNLKKSKKHFIADVLYTQLHIDMWDRDYSEGHRIRIRR